MLLKIKKIIFLKACNRIQSTVLRTSYKKSLFSLTHSLTHTHAQTYESFQKAPMEMKLNLKFLQSVCNYLPDDTMSHRYLHWVHSFLKPLQTV